MSEEKKGHLTPTQYRFVGYIPIIPCMILAFLLFQPDIVEIIAASIAGVFTAVYDWSIEAYAYKKGLWFCHGGIQKIELGDKVIDFKHVPIDMVISFWFFGFMYSILATFPDRNRTLYHFISDPALTNPALDFVWIAILCVIMATLGAIFDFHSKRSGVWENGKTWTFWKCAYYAWLSLIGFTVIIFYSLIGISMII
ncbi:MAG: hypothetical protein ACTSO9_19600 [Candidatus Helarchaeota archaeon]